MNEPSTYPVNVEKLLTLLSGWTEKHPTIEEVRTILNKMMALIDKNNTATKTAVEKVLENMGTISKNVTESHQATLHEHLGTLTNLQKETIASITAKVEERLASVKDGEPGADAPVPVKGIDYFDGEPGKDAELPTEETLKALMEPLFNEMEARVAKKINELPRGGARSSHTVRVTDLSSQTNGSRKVFAVPEGLSGILFSSDFPTILMEGNGFTLNATRTQLTMTTVTAPSSKSQLLYQSTDIHNY